METNTSRKLTGKRIVATNKCGSIMWTGTIESVKVGQPYILNVLHDDNTNTSLKLGILSASLLAHNGWVNTNNQTFEIN